MGWLKNVFSSSKPVDERTRSIQAYLSLPKEARAEIEKEFKRVNIEIRSIIALELAMKNPIVTNTPEDQRIINRINSIADQIIPRFKLTGDQFQGLLHLHMR
jgi:hypothetical protein